MNGIKLFLLWVVLTLVFDLVASIGEHQLFNLDRKFGRFDGWALVTPINIGIWWLIYILLI